MCSTTPFDLVTEPDTDSIIITIRITSRKHCMYYTRLIWYMKRASFNGKCAQVSFISSIQMMFKGPFIRRG